jgi:hypothetical protein
MKCLGEKEGELSRNEQSVNRVYKLNWAAELKPKGRSMEVTPRG